MMIEEIKDAISKAESLPFLFIGSGLSRRYLDTPDWKGLLTDLAFKARPELDSPGVAFELYKNDAERPDSYPCITSAIEKDLTKKLLTSPDYQIFRKNHSEEIKAGVASLNLIVGDTFKEISPNNTEILSHEEIESFREIENKVAGVITTNFDLMLESIFPKFKVYIGQEDLLFQRTFFTAEIYKIHGCCTKPESLVLTDKHYSAYNEKSSYLSAKLLTIFLEHPIIFIGYSLTDTNILDIFSNISKCLNTEQLNHLSTRLFFVTREEGAKGVKVVTTEKNFGPQSIQMTTIITDDFSSIYNTIASIKTKYPPTVLRKFKQDIYEIVRTCDAQNKIHVASVSSPDELEACADELECVIGFGLADHLSKIGYKQPSAQDLFEDLLFDNKRYNLQLIAQHALPHILASASNSTPIFKYIQGIDIESLHERVVDNIRKREVYNDLISNSFQKSFPQEETMGKLREKFTRNQEGDKLFLQEIAKLKEEHINVDELGEALKEIFGRYPNLLEDKHWNKALKTNFRRMGKAYDWLRYSEKNKAPEA